MPAQLLTECRPNACTESHDGLTEPESNDNHDCRPAHRRELSRCPLSSRRRAEINCVLYRTAWVHGRTPTAACVCQCLARTAASSAERSGRVRFPLHARWTTSGPWRMEPRCSPCGRPPILYRRAEEVGDPFPESDG